MTLDEAMKTRKDTMKRYKRSQVIESQKGYSKGQYWLRWNNASFDAEDRFRILDGEFTRWFDGEIASLPDDVPIVKDKFLMYACEEYIAACLDTELLGLDPSKVRVEVCSPFAYEGDVSEVVTIKARRLISEARKLKGWNGAIARVWRPGSKSPFYIDMWP